jgi:hypothetical protein
VQVEAALFAEYDFTSRQVKNHRAQIREHHEFREPTVGDEDKLIVWLAADICKGGVKGEVGFDRPRPAPGEPHVPPGGGDVGGGNHG